MEKLKTKPAKVDKRWTKSGQIKNKTSESGQKVDKLKTKPAKVDKKWTSYGEYGWLGGILEHFPYFGAQFCLGPPKMGADGHTTAQKYNIRHGACL